MIFLRKRIGNNFLSAKGLLLGDFSLVVFLGFELL